MTISLIIFAICVAGSAFSSGSEIALVSASRRRLRQMASEGLQNARRALDLIADKDRTLAVILIATNVFNISCGAIAAVMCERWIGPAGPIVATLVVTSVLLVIGEIVPKALFLYHADRLLSMSSLIWRVLLFLCTPITVPINLVTKVVCRLIGNGHKPAYSTTRDEIKLVLEESAESGGLQQDQQEMLQSALNYATTIAREVMVPISEVALLPETASTQELMDLVRREGHTRTPVYRERIDQIIGFVNIFDLFFDKPHKTYIRSYIRSARLVPETKQIDELFLEMQRKRESIAVVVNEFGACFGIITLEDIMEEIFGELADEHEDPRPEIQAKGGGVYHVDGTADIDDLKSVTGIEIEKAGFETVAGYVLYRFGKIPQKGESFTDGSVRVNILEADRYAVKAVEMVREGNGAHSEV
jgi:putative hemolysin